MAEKIAPVLKTILYNTINWSAQQISDAIQVGNAGHASVRFPPDSPDTIEITTADFSIFFGALARISAVKPASSLKQENTVPNISHQTPVTETVKNRGKLLRAFVNVFDFKALSKRFAGTIHPQRQI